MVVTVFAKGIPANSVSVDFGEQLVCYLSTDSFCMHMYLLSQFGSFHFLADNWLCAFFFCMFLFPFFLIFVWLFHS